MKLVLVLLFAILFHPSVCDDDSSQEDKDDKSEEVMKELKKNVTFLWSYVRKMHRDMEQDIHELQLQQREVTDKMMSIFGVELEHSDEGHKHAHDSGHDHRNDSHLHGHHDHHHNDGHHDHHDEGHHDRHDEGHHDHHDEGHHGHYDEGHHDHHDEGHHDHHDEGHHDHHDDGHHDHDDGHHDDHHDDHHDSAHSMHQDQHHDEHSGHHAEHPHDHHDDHHHDNHSDSSSSHPAGHKLEQSPHRHDDQDHSHHEHTSESTHSEHDDHHKHTSEHTSESSHGEHDGHRDYTSNETDSKETRHHHQHHHHHQGAHSHHSHKHSSRFDPCKYDFAVCKVQPNLAIPEEQQQNVTGIIRLWQKKNGTTLHIHVKVQGFKVNGDHSEHFPRNEDEAIPGGSESRHSKHRHGFHVHKKGDLSNGCQSTGPHYSVEKVDHGGPKSPIRHTGDLGNIECNDHGVTNVVLTDEIASLQGPDSIIGRSLVIHERRDDLGVFKDNEASRSSGDAGVRIACCIIEKADRLPTGYDHHHGSHHHHHHSRHHSHN